MVAAHTPTSGHSPRPSLRYQASAGPQRPPKRGEFAELAAGRQKGRTPSRTLATRHHIVRLTPNTALMAAHSDGISLHCACTGAESATAADAVVLITTRGPDDRLCQQLVGRAEDWSDAACAVSALPVTADAPPPSLRWCTRDATGTRVRASRRRSSAGYPVRGHRTVRRLPMSTSRRPPTRDDATAAR